MFSKFQKTIESCFLLLFFVTPLIMFPKTSELFELNKMMFVYLMTSIIFAFWLGKMIIAKKIIFRRSPLDYVLLLFVGSQIASTIFSIDVHTSIFGYYSRFNGGLLSIICYVLLYYAYISNCVFETEKKTRNFAGKMLVSLLLTSALVVLWGIPGSLGHDLTCKLFAGSFDNTCWTDQFRPAERMFSTLGQPNWLGSYLVVTFFIGLFFLHKHALKKYNRYIVLFYLFLTVCGVLLTRSRSALFALIFGLVIVGYIYRKNILEQKRNVLLIILLLIVIPCIICKTGVGFIDRYIPSFTTSVTQRETTISPSKNTSQTATTNNVTDSFDIRKIVWLGAWRLGIRYPLFGTGVETFAYAYNFVRPEAHNITSEWDLVYNKAHNEYLNYLATTGFVGLGSYLLFIIYYLLLSFKKIKEHKDDDLIIFLTVAWMTILITNFFGFSTVTTNLLFYLLPALLTVWYYESATTPTEYTVSHGRNYFAVLASSLLIIVNVWSIGIFMVADINYAMADASGRSQDYNGAVTHLTRALSLHYEHVYRDKLSTALTNKILFEDYQNVISVNTSDKKKLAVLQQQINESFTKADKLNMESIAASPKNISYWKTRAKNYYILFQITQSNTDFDKAMAALDTAKKIAPTDPKIPYSQAVFNLARLDNDKKGDVKLENIILAYLNKAIQLKKDYRDAYYAKGLLLKKLGKTKEADATFQYILSHINPDDTEVKNELGK